MKPTIRVIASSRNDPGLLFITHAVNLADEFSSEFERKGMLQFFQDIPRGNSNPSFPQSDDEDSRDGSMLKWNYPKTADEFRNRMKSSSAIPAMLSSEKEASLNRSRTNISGSRGRDPRTVNVSVLMTAFKK
jgi:hypothetical protein